MTSAALCLMFIGVAIGSALSAWLGDWAAIWLGVFGAAVFLAYVIGVVERESGK